VDSLLAGGASVNTEELSKKHAQELEALRVQLTAQHEAAVDAATKAAKTEAATAHLASQTHRNISIACMGLYRSLLFAFSCGMSSSGALAIGFAYTQSFFPLLPAGVVVLALLMFIAEGYSSIVLLSRMNLMSREVDANVTGLDNRRTSKKQLSQMHAGCCL
jgi:outer membrane murein-binding lipoprotein Lpp